MPPTGAKGLNLAVADVKLLAEALVDFLRSAATTGIDGYSDAALQHVWRAEHFSWFMTSMLHRFPDSDEFDLGLQKSQLHYTTSSEAAMTMLAENYTGLTA